MRPDVVRTSSDVRGAAENHETGRPVPRRREDPRRGVALHLEGVDLHAGITGEPGDVPQEGGPGLATAFGDATTVVKARRRAR